MLTTNIKLNTKGYTSNLLNKLNNSFLFNKTNNKHKQTATEHKTSLEFTPSNYTKIIFINKNDTIHLKSLLAIFTYKSIDLAIKKLNINKTINPS